MKQHFVDQQLYFIIKRVRQMIKFQRKTKQKNAIPSQYTQKVQESIIRKSDAQLTDVLINGVQLPGYRKLRSTKRRRQRHHHLSTSLSEVHRKQSQQGTSGLFKNTAIRTRLKSLQIQISITARHSPQNLLSRKHSSQKQPAAKLDQFLKTSTFTYQKPKSERYINVHTAVNWTNRTCRVKQYNLQQSVRCHSTKNRGDNPLWISHNHFKEVCVKNDKGGHPASRLNNSKGFNDSLLAQKQKFLSLRQSQGTKEVSLRSSSPNPNKNNSIQSSSIFKQSPCAFKSKSKVCYSIKLRKQQKMQTNTSRNMQSSKAIQPHFQEQQLNCDN